MTIRRALAATALSLLTPCWLHCGPAAGPASPPIAAELQPLQGKWEGFMAGNETSKITVTINGNSLHFYRDADFWYETTLTLPAGAYPPQLHATIKACPQPCAEIGKVVHAIFKVEAETLTLIGIQATAVEPPQTFDEIPGSENSGVFRYTLKKVPPALVRDPIGNTHPRKRIA